MGQMATGARHRTVARRFGACAVLVPLTDARWTCVACCGSDDGGEGSEFSVCELGTDCALHYPSNACYGALLTWHFRKALVTVPSNLHA